MRIFIALLISAALAAANPLVFLSGSPSSGAAVGGLYTFEETGACAGWVDASTNETSTVNWDYSTSPLDGSQSLFLADSTTDDRIAKYDFTEDADEIWIAFRFREWAKPAIESQNIGIEDSAGANLASVMVSTGGNLAFEVTTANSGTVAFLTGGSSYRVKIRYLKGTLNNETMQVWAVAEGLGIVGEPLRLFQTAHQQIGPLLLFAATTATKTKMSLLMTDSGNHASWSIWMTGGAVTGTYASKGGSSSIIYNLSREVQIGETRTNSYTQPGNGAEDTAGNDLATLLRSISM